jgi:flagellar basal-body rod modification protein FlgD
MELPPVNDYVLPAPPPPKANYLDQAMFLRLLVAQLTTQNPLEPMTERDFFAQLAQIGTVQGVDRIGTSMQMAQAAGMIGRTVEAMPSHAEGGTGMPIYGKVQAVEVADRKVYVRIDGRRVSIDNVTKIIA